MRFAALLLISALLGCEGAGAAERAPPHHPTQEPAPETSPTDWRKAKCDDGDGEACWTIGYRYEKGYSDQDGFYPQDYGAAANHYKRGCTLGALSACNGFARLLRDGHGVTRDDRGATNLFVATCERGDAMSCAEAGVAHLNIDVARAEAFFRKACTGGSIAGCKALERMATMPRDATVPPPVGGGGFRLGSTLEEAAAACRGGGFDWMVAVENETHGKCTGVPGKVGLDVAYVQSCASGKVCDIMLGKTLSPSNPNQWPNEFQAKLTTLEAHYGKPSELKHKVPTECSTTLANCIESKRAEIHAWWTWASGEQVVLVVTVITGRPGLWVKYLTAESSRRANVNSL